MQITNLNQLYQQNFAGRSNEIKITNDLRIQLKKMIDKNLGYVDIAKVLGIKEANVHSIICRCGLNNVRKDNLHKRNVEILKMLDEGVPTKEIAKKMDLTKACIYSLKQKLNKEKLEVSNNLSNQLLEQIMKKLNLSPEQLKDSIKF